MRGWGWPTWAGLTRLREGQWTEAGWGWPGASSSVVEHLESRITITSYTIIHTDTRNLSLSTPTEHSLTTLFTSHQSRSSPSPSSLLTLTSIMSHDPSLLTLTLTPHTHPHSSHSPLTLTLVITLCRRWSSDRRPVGLAVQRHFLHVINLVPGDAQPCHSMPHQ